MFVVEIPPDFDRAVDRGETPGVLIDADATDPTAIGNAVAALGQAANDLNRDLPPIRQMQPQTPPFQFVVHARYNPEQLTVLNVVPGLVCIVLMFSTLFVTTMAITKERERGTMENLLAMPVRPIEVMIAKIAPYVVIGYIQVMLILVAASIFFALPIRGSVPLLLGALGVFIASNLALGVTFSTVSANQMQAVQLAQFTLMPSFMLSGFMFPFRGMPVWAQVIGNVFPTTHAMRIVRGMLLKGDGWTEIAPELWPMAAIHRRDHRLRDARLPRDAGLSLDQDGAEGVEGSLKRPAASLWRAPFDGDQRSVIRLLIDCLKSQRIGAIGLRCARVHNERKRL